MASPQVKKGFTGIAHEIMHAFMKLSINGTQFRLLCVLLRKTYGWQKTVDAIALSQFEKHTGITNRRLIVRELQKLEDRNIILVERSSHQTNLYKFNKDYDQWDDKTASAQIDTTPNVRIDTTPSVQVDTTPRVQTTPYNINIVKDMSLKEIFEKERKQCADAHPYLVISQKERFESAEKLRDQFYSAYEKTLGKPYKANSDRHISVFRKLVRAWPEKDLTYAIDQFFWYFQGDSWMTDEGFTLRHFSSKVNTLLGVWYYTPKEKEDVDALRQYYADGCKKKFGWPYFATSIAKDRRIFKKLLEEDSVEELKVLIDKLFASKDPFVENSNYCVALFNSQVPMLKHVKRGKDYYNKKKPIYPKPNSTSTYEPMYQEQDWG